MIHLAKLTKTFGSLVAVDHLSLRVAAGETYALLGPNGAGKTTALRCLATLMRPVEGTVRVAGFDALARPLEVRRRMAFLAASMGLYPRLTARELVAYFGRLHGLEGEDLERRLNHVVEVFDLTDFQHRLCGRLSTGQRQRVALARALVHDPPVLILDEPTLGLDLISGGAIHAFMRRERERGKAVLFSTHQMEEVELLADRVGVMARGRLVAEGTPREIMEAAGAPDLTRAFLTLVRADDGASDGLRSPSGGSSAHA
ncbi:MAG: ABC transporter ATP-binding protein [Gemmatimonadota bacterium]